MTRTLWRAGREWTLGLGGFLMTALSDGQAVAQDELYVANCGANSVPVYARTANGDQPPLRTLLGGNTALSGPVPVIVDPIHDEVIVASAPGSGSPSILVYPRNASGDTPPIRRIQGPSTASRRP